MEEFGLMFRMFSGVADLGGRGVFMSPGKEDPGGPKEKFAGTPGPSEDPKSVGIRGGKLIGKGCSIDVGVPKMKNMMRSYL